MEYVYGFKVKDPITCCGECRGKVVSEINNHGGRTTWCKFDRKCSTIVDENVKPDWCPLTLINVIVDEQEEKTDGEQRKESNTNII